MKTITETSAGGIVYKREEGQTFWLITQHSQLGHWSFPKGLIGDTDSTEKAETAALREVREEGGIEAQIMNPKPFESHYTYFNGKEQVVKTVFFFLMEYVSGNIKDHDWEVSDIKWATRDEVMSRLTFENDKEVFENLLGAVEGI